MKKLVNYDNLEQFYEVRLKVITLLGKEVTVKIIESKTLRDFNYSPSNDRHQKHFEWKGISKPTQEEIYNFYREEADTIKLAEQIKVSKQILMPIYLDSKMEIREGCRRKTAEIINSEDVDFVLNTPYEVWVFPSNLTDQQWVFQIAPIHRKEFQPLRWEAYEDARCLLLFPKEKAMELFGVSESEYNKIEGTYNLYGEYCNGGGSTATPYTRFTTFYGKKANVTNLSNTKFKKWFLNNVDAIHHEHVPPYAFQIFSDPDLKEQFASEGSEAVFDEIKRRKLLTKSSLSVSAKKMAKSLDDFKKKFVNEESDEEAFGIVVNLLKKMAAKKR